jgi:hypothetical protein
MQTTSEDKKTRQKRVVRRKTVSSTTVCAVSGDTWLLVCANLFFSPVCVLRLMRTSKTIWLALKNNPIWWKTFFDRVVLYQSVLGSGKYLGTLKEFSKMTQNKRSVIHLVFSSECCGCGVRYGHSIFKPLMKRLCQTCIHDKLISNRVLLYKYGVHFSDFLLEYCEKGGILMAHTLPKPTITSFLRVTSEPLDLVQKSSTTSSGNPRGNKMLFFEKSVLKEALGIHLEDCLVQTKGKKNAVTALFARFRRLRTQDLFINTSKHWAIGVEAARSHEIQRMIHPLKLCTIGMVGGPYNSFPTNMKANDIQRRHTITIKRRQGMTAELIGRMEQCVDSQAIILD